jgi:pre-mRNA-processing factor 17
MQGVKDISFSNDGRKFLSSSYDKVVKLWDTETGKVLCSLGEGKMFFTARCVPSASHSCHLGAIMTWPLQLEAQTSQVVASSARAR